MRKSRGIQTSKKEIVVPNAQSATLLPIIREKVKPDSIVYTDTFRSYDVLDVSEFSHFRH